MKFFALSYIGMEEITALEIKEILDVETEIRESCVIFESDEESVARYIYKAQGVNRVLLLIDQFNIKEEEDLKRVKDIDFSKWLTGKKFAVRASAIHTDLNTREMESVAGYNIEGDVDLKNPDVTIYIYVVKDVCYLGIDFSGDLSKRDYKIFSARNDMKGTLAYALVRLSGYTFGKTFFNPSCWNGTIAIEAALFGSGKSVHYFNKDKFPFLKFLKVNLSSFDDEDKEIQVFAHSNQEGYMKTAKKNAIISGVVLKYGELNNPDCVVTYNGKDIKIKNLEKERIIEHGKASVKIVTFLNAC